MSQQTPIISAITKYLGVRRNKMWLRYKDEISPRTIPKPNIPPGVNSKLAKNYYYTRDERRKAAPPFIIASAIHSVSPRIEAGTRDACTKVLVSFHHITPSINPIWPTDNLGETYMKSYSLGDTLTISETTSLESAEVTKSVEDPAKLPTPGFRPVWTISSDEPYQRN